MTTTNLLITRTAGNVHIECSISILVDPQCPIISFPGILFGGDVHIDLAPDDDTCIQMDVATGTFKITLESVTLMNVPMAALASTIRSVQIYAPNTGEAVRLVCWLIQLCGLLTDPIDQYVSVDTASDAFTDPAGFVRWLNELTHEQVSVVHVPE